MKKFSKEFPLKEFPADVSGFVLVSDELIKIHGPLTALVFGKVWRYCQMKDKVCRASLPRLANELGLSVSTIQRHIHLLVKNKYLRDKTPKLKNKPHLYQDMGNVTMKIHMKMTLHKAGYARMFADDEGLWVWNDESQEYILKKKKN
jgi:hypothetical protein